MSEEDPEIRDLVAQTLESKGVLAKIRAELRANVFLALEEQADGQDKNAFISKPLSEYLKSPEGVLATCIVREFLEYFELDYTLSVFDPESQHGKEYNYEGRNKLIQDLQVKDLNGRKGPVLGQLLQFVQSGHYSPFSTKEERSKDSSLINGMLSHPMNGETDMFFSSGNKSIAVPLISDPDDSNSPRLPLSMSKVHLEENRAVTQRNRLNEESKKKSDFLTDLKIQNLSIPDPSNSEKMENKLTDQKLPSIFGDGKQLPIESPRTGQLDTYEEDFQSSVSLSANERRSSDTEEIEEDVQSGIDDLLSNASGMDNFTFDATVSDPSAAGDYVEKL